MHLSSQLAAEMPEARSPLPSFGLPGVGAVLFHRAGPPSVGAGQLTVRSGPSTARAGSLPARAGSLPARAGSLPARRGRAEPPVVRLVVIRPGARPVVTRPVVTA
ncbi:hypothetical protein AB0G87_02365 [Streptomyces asoensis]|uniref:hypothetical protein n=1 Tax=Streptomyces asoensis TaxID=249586 RepID=UPI0033D26858